MRIIAEVCAVILLGIVIGLWLFRGPGVPDCVEEDGSGGPVPCYWDGTERGNGVGESYIVGR